MGCARRAQNWNYISSKLWCSYFNTISILKLFFVSCNINFNLKLAPKIFLRAARAKLKLFSIEITMNLFSVTISILPAKIVIFRFAPFYKRPVDKHKLKFHRRRNTYKTFYAMAYALCRQAENSFYVKCCYSLHILISISNYCARSAPRNLSKIEIAFVRNYV